MANLSKEELMRPRYKVIAHYPGSTWNMNEVITCADFVNHEECYGKFPHLFRPLQWWEERAIEDMPEYVMFRGSIITWDTCRFYGYQKTGMCSLLDEPDYTAYITSKTTTNE